MLPPDRWPDVERLFRTVLDADADEAARLLADADADVATEVQALLDAEHDADTFFGRPPDLGDADEMEDDLPRGTRLGPWEVAEELGRGGMGTVYRARRADGAYAQDVAVKVVHRGMDSAQIVRRFQQERTLLATLAHEGVARLIDGGVAGDGRPYLVMELVAGQPLTAYADARRLPVEARIQLFLDVCAAVAHAHQRLVVHRDLKPSNILVSDDEATTSGDAQPHVKLLDFGIARLLAPTDEAEALTAPDLRLFTPRYAAPEQATGAPSTTAADVYSLGAVLVELLVGAPPAPPGPDRAPDRPSEMLRRRPAEVAAVAEARATTPDRLARALRGDLDAICQKAIRAEPDARYPSADALADDLKRHLGGLPVHARVGTRRYVAGRFVRRHRWAAAAAAFCIVVLGASTAVVALQNRRIAHERDIALGVAGMMEDVLLQIDPGGRIHGAASVRDLLDESAVRIDRVEDPEARARLLDVMGRVYRALADTARALPMQREAVRLYAAARGPSDRETLLAEHHLAYLLATMGHLAEAERKYEHVLTLRRTHGTPSDLVESLSDLGQLYAEQGRLEEAAALSREGLDLLVRHPNAGPPDLEGPLSRAYFVLLLGRIRLTEGRLAEAEPLLREAVALYARHRGPDHTYTASASGSLAQLFQQQGRYDEADGLMRRGVEVQERTWGPGHPWALSALASRAAARCTAGQLDTARALYRTLEQRAESVRDTARASEARRGAARCGQPAP